MCNFQWPFNDLLRMANMGELSTYANKAKILQARNSKKGTQLKIEVLLDGDQLALFKPQWYPRDIKIVGKAFSGKDRHFGEIASFYLNLILGYNVAPITVGRNVNLMTEILPYASKQLRQTFYRENSMLIFNSRYKTHVNGSVIFKIEKKAISLCMHTNSCGAYTKLFQMGLFAFTEFATTVNRKMSFVVTTRILLKGQWY